MADFFGNLKKNLTETAELVAKKTGEVADVVAKKTEQTVEVTKIKNQIRTMEKNNERDLLDMGKMIYESFKKDEEVCDCFKELCETIKEREEAIEKMNEEVAELKGKGLCPECKNHVDPNAAFCAKCGTKLEQTVEFVNVEIVDVDDFAEEVVEEVAEEEFEEE